MLQLEDLEQIQEDNEAFCKQSEMSQINLSNYQMFKHGFIENQDDEDYLKS